MPQSPQPKSYLPQPPSTTPSRGEPRFSNQVANACRLKHLFTDAIPSARRSARPPQKRLRSIA
jgi:hypothetical protein